MIITILIGQIFYRKLDKLEEEFSKREEHLEPSMKNCMNLSTTSIVNGDAGPEGDSNEAATKQEPATCKCTCVKAVTEPDLVAFIRSRVNGVPGFWLHALSKNNLLTREVIVSAECFSTLLVIQITALINCFPSYLFNQIIGRDTEALAYLRDIKGSKIDGDNKGFKLDFYFEPNNFFMNPVLTKTYHMVDEGVPILAKAIGTEIEWYPGRCLTKNTIEKNSKKGSFPKRTENRKSFFNFFSTYKVLEDIDAVRNQMEIDYEIGFVKDVLVDLFLPSCYLAVSWFTGEAWRSTDEYSDTEGDDDEDDDEDDE
ncbi:putative nucleosome assembly protein (NAP) [Rosa chinensis]|uniref:Putative nucleosome assembly protein (NAP) n=1 Tax=Rosa chinensis TaxID=74649 RepID=A0A2P6PSU0_ROSCH|nr:putative nucleosome assembly protein (NAP) [Rosa chinensis]